MNNYIKISLDYIISCKQSRFKNEFKINYIAIGNVCCSSITYSHNMIVYSEYLRNTNIYVPSYKNISEEMFTKVSSKYIKTTYFTKDMVDVISYQEINVNEYVDKLKKLIMLS
mgnify:CR=1 FL=1